MIYCFNSEHKFISKHITYDNTLFNMLKFYYNDKRIGSFIITKHNDEVSNIDEIYHMIRQQTNRLFVDESYMFIRSIDFERFYKLKFLTYNEFLSYIKQYHEYTGVKNNIYQDSTIDSYDTSNYKKQINFYTISNTLGMPNRGPIIQTENKIYYFKRDIEKFNIGIQNKFSFCNGTHILNPDCRVLSGSNVSVGPNIDLKSLRCGGGKDRFVVADSEGMKDYLIDNFNVSKDLISVIPIYVTEDFYETEVESNKDIIGIVGYPRHDDVKNMLSLAKICKRFPNLKFEMLSSRNKSCFPKEVQSIPNLTFYNVPHSKTIEIMKRWGMYIGLSKRERGPAALQELKVLGIPTICPNHTGYSEFKPLIGLDIEPFRDHSTSDLDMISDAIAMVNRDQYKYLQLAQEERDRFGANEKSTKIISKKGEDFFSNCIGV